MRYDVGVIILFLLVAAVFIGVVVGKTIISYTEGEVDSKFHKRDNDRHKGFYRWVYEVAYVQSTDEQLLIQQRKKEFKNG